MYFIDSHSHFIAMEFAFVSAAVDPALDGCLRVFPLGGYVREYLYQPNTPGKVRKGTRVGG